MSWIIEAGIALSLVALAGGFVAYLVISTTFRKIKEIEAQEKDTAKFENRLKELEQRVTDMQEILLSFDDQLKPPRAPKPELS